MENQTKGRAESATDMEKIKEWKQYKQGGEGKRKKNNRAEKETDTQREETIRK